MDYNELRRKRDALDDQIREIERAREEKELSALVGRCYRYRNSYSCPQSDDDCWWLYTRVIGVEDGALKAFRFQDDKRGKLETECVSAWGSTLGEEISPAEFQDALRAHADTLAKMIAAQQEQA